MSHWLHHCSRTLSLSPHNRLLVFRAIECRWLRVRFKTFRTSGVQLDQGKPESWVGEIARLEQVCFVKWSSFCLFIGLLLQATGMPTGVVHCKL